MQIGVSGIHGGIQRLNEHGSQIARANLPDAEVDVANELVGLMRAETEVAANAKTVKAADAALGSLLDIFA